MVLLADLLKRWRSNSKLNSKVHCAESSAAVDAVSAVVVALSAVVVVLSAVVVAAIYIVGTIQAHHLLDI